MANYKLGPVIGKIGGAEVQKIPVEAVTDGGTGAEVIMHTVHVPEGETWLVALAGDLNPYATASNVLPELSIGEISLRTELNRGYTSIAAEVTGTAEITLKRNNRNGADTFSGHIYVAPLP